jgi:glycosyltransferase involved in cell wall biosynthesis
MDYGRSIFELAKSLRQAIASRHPDIVHANSVRAGIVCTLAALGTGQKVAWHIHDRSPRHLISTLIRLLALVAPKLRTIAITQESRTSFRGRLLQLFSNRAPTTVILNAIDLDRFHPEARTREETRTALGYSSQNFVIGIVGQISPHKNQLGLVRAFAKVAADDPNIRLLVVGAPLFNDSKLYLDFLIKEAERLCVRNAIQFVGQQSDVGRFMQAMDLFVLNSVAEPFGLVVVEAMANGTPILATRAGGVPEIVREGFNGFLVPPQDDDALVAALRQLIQDRPALDSARNNALSDVRQRFSLQRYMSELELFYLDFAAER